jgi:iron complex transport system substrate-binding protein
MLNDEIPMIKQMPMPMSNLSLSGHLPFNFRHSLVIQVSSFVMLTMLLAACDKTISPTTQPTAPTIASMVPAATDLLVGMGAKDHLVAVSTYDKDRADVGSLPKAGDYETVDWELLRSLHPAILITQIKPELQPAGFKEKADQMHILPVNIQIERLNDIFNAIDTLGDALKDPVMATAAKQKMQDRLDAVKKRVAGQSPVRTLIVTGSSFEFIAAPGSYLDDLLQVAGGVNACPPSAQHWPRIDREMLLSLNPDAIIQLMPNATVQEREQASKIWKQSPQLSAVTTARVYPIYEAYAQQPGWHVTDLAEHFAKLLHP